MPSVRQYRQELYRLRTHPQENALPADPRDSFVRLYFSVIPFAIAEYLVELHSDVLPSGLVFPVGFILFWAFYYTYYRPGALEDRLSALPSRSELWAIPGLLVGVVIWFVKGTLVELVSLVVPKPKPKQKIYRRRPVQGHAHARTNPAYGAPRPSAVHSPPPPVQLPREVVAALLTLGIPQERSFKKVHKRYRELAKQYHPDLNPNVTSSGKDFMRFDSAYREILKVRARYFSA